MLLNIKKMIWDISAKSKNFFGKERLIALITRPKNLGKINIIRGGVNFQIQGHDLNEFALAVRKNHSPPLSETISKEISNNNIKIFWDIGANIGAISLPLLKKFSQLNALLFEPSAEVAGRLIKNLSKNPDLFTRTTILNIALSSTSGLTNFFVSNEDFNSGVAGLSQSHNRESFSMKVQSYTGDDIVMIHNYPAPELIKIDVEGFEFEVLKGLEKTLQKKHPIIIFEHSQYRFSERGQEKNLVINYLRSLGYKIFNQSTDLEVTDRDLNIDSDFIAKKI